MGVLAHQLYKNIAFKVGSCLQWWYSIKDTMFLKRYGFVYLSADLTPDCLLNPVTQLLYTAMNWSVELLNDDNIWIS